MIVRRLIALGSQVAAVVVRVFGRGTTLLFGHRVAPFPAQGSASAAPSSAATPPRPTYSGTNWLEDARRLRGRPVPRMLPPRPAPAALRQVLWDPHWISAFEAGRLAPPARPSRPLDERARRDATRDAPPDPFQETLQALPHRPPAPSGSAPAPDSPAAAGADARSEAEAQRRLLLIRELVRRGLYNEGFKPGHVPEQYRPHSTPDLPPE